MQKYDNVSEFIQRFFSLDRKLYYKIKPFNRFAS